MSFFKRTSSTWVVLSILVFLLAMMIINVIRKIIVFVWKPFLYRRFMEAQGILGPKPVVMTGNVGEIEAMRREVWKPPMDTISHDYVDRLFPHYQAWTERYGPRFYFWLGAQPVLLETDPDLIKQVFSSDHRGPYAKHGPQTVLSKRITGDALFALNGMKWLHRRRAVRPAFHAELLEGLVEPIAKSIEAILFDDWEKRLQLSSDGAECYVDNIVPRMAALTGDIVARTLFRSSYDDSNEAFEQHKELVKLEFHAHPLPSSWTPASLYSYVCTVFNRYRRRRELHLSILTTVKRMVEKAMTEETDKPGHICKDFLGLLLAVNRQPDTLSGGFRMSMDDLIQEARSFYTAGYQAPATSLNWILMLLGLYPTWQDRIYEEIRAVCDLNKPLTMKTLNQVNNLSMVIYEALRLYTPAPEAHRTATRDVQLGNVRILRGTSVSVCIPKVHRLPQFWGPDANEFKPERFRDGLCSARKHPVAYMPFSFGPRYCVARTFALLEVKCIVAMIIQRFRFQLSPTYVHAPIIVGVGIQPKHGIPILLSRREEQS